jgi:hypothetical protein
MRSTAFVLLFCIGLLAVGCDDKPTPPGGPMPKASAVVSMLALSAS